MTGERERGRENNDALWQGPPEKGKTLAAAGDSSHSALGVSIKYV